VAWIHVWTTCPYWSAMTPLWYPPGLPVFVMIFLHVAHSGAPGRWRHGKIVRMSHETGHFPERRSPAGYGPQPALPAPQQPPPERHAIPAHLLASGSLGTSVRSVFVLF